MKLFTFVLFVASMLLADFYHAQENDPYQLPADRLADVLINFSLELKPREKIAISTSFEANDLNIALYKKALAVGAFPTILCDIPGRKEVYYKYANEEQLSNYDELLHYVVSNFDVILWVEAHSNLKSMNNVEPKKISLSTKANSEILRKLVERSDNGELFESLLKTDESAKVIGEIGIGTNYDIKRYTKKTSFSMRK
jgi:leucyl aminopeptidase (aminopeptidase T)